MTDRGWSADASVVLRHRAVTWLAEQQREEPGRIKSNADVAAALEVEVRDVVAEVDMLAADGICMPADGMVPASSSARLTPTGASLASTWAAARRSRRHRSSACKDALLDWLYEQPSVVPDASAFLEDVRAHFYGGRFNEGECNESLADLGALGLVQGVRTAQSESLLRPKVTADGKTCVEGYDSNVGAWLARAGSGTTFAISNSQGVTIASNSPGATQSVTITTDARQQMLQTADALLATLPVLGLDPEDEVRAHEVADRLRAEAEQDESEPGRVRAVLKDARTIAVSGTGSAAGVGIVALAQQIAQSLGL